MRRPWTPEPGDLRHKAKITSPGNSLAAQWEDENPAGNTIGPFRCAVRTRAVGENQDASGMVSTTRYDIYFRHQAAMATVPTDSIVEFTMGTLTGKKVHVMADDPMDGRGNWINLVCEMRSADG